MEKEEREMILEKVLTPSDVGKLNHLVIPTQIAEKHFPLTSVNNDEGGLLLEFEDATGKIWKFRYSYWYPSQSYVFTKGWSRYVEENKLNPGDVLLLQRHRFDHSRSFIACRHHSSKKLLVTGDIVIEGRRSNAFRSSANRSSGNELDLDPMLLDPVLSFACSFFFHLFPPDYEFERDKLVQLLMTMNFHFCKDEFFTEHIDQFFELAYVQFSRTDLLTGNPLFKFNWEFFKPTSTTHFPMIPDPNSSTTHFLMIPGRNSSTTHFLMIPDPNSSTTHFLMIPDPNSSSNHPSPNTFHVSVCCNNNINSTTLDELARFKHLKSLLFLHAHKSSFAQIPRNLFLSLEVLLVLDLSRSHVTELPSSLGSMLYLTYLDVSHTPIKRLPETIDKLIFLQTLKLRGCKNLIALPKGIRKLELLLHLDLDVLHQLHSMPHGIGALTKLQTLSAFLVGVEQECSIRQLKNMNSLSGSLCISNLENVLTPNEAIEACLSNKENLKRLEFRWSISPDGNTVGDDKIFSRLLPNENLEELHILCYGGLELPNWLCLPIFSKLVNITLVSCENCLILPSFGRLPSLKVLNIVDFHTLKGIDGNFYGVGVEHFVAFPKLESITLENMDSFKEWKDCEYPHHFPCLRKLIIKHCPKLHTVCTLSSLRALDYLELCHCSMLASSCDEKLPDSLQTLIIEACPKLSESLLRDGNQDGRNIAHVPCIWVDHQELTFG